MKRSKFSLSNYKLLSCNMGKLIPIGLTEVLPGDTVQHATSALIRVSPMLAPVMHPVHVRVHHWYVPFRLIWEDFEDFITGGPDGMDASELPTWSYSGVPVAAGDLEDYLGLPLGFEGTTSVLPIRAYDLIFNEWYRDQDLVTEIPIDFGSGTDATTGNTIQDIAWEKDYFTSARPWEQKGPSISIPLTGDAPITGIGTIDGNFSNLGVSVTETGGGTPTYGNSRQTSAAGAIAVKGTASTGGAPEIFADLSGVSAVDMNALREAMALQRFEEARARYGSRYVEYLRYLGVRSSDARLQRPEYLGGGKQTIQFSEVLQTAPDASSGFVGSMKGHGIAAMRSNRYRRYFEEHGYVMSLLSVRPKTIYTDGVHRLWNRRIKEDFWQKELEHIGQQAILNKELYAAHTTPEGVFGYQDRYDEYRRVESTVAGEFRESTLDFWHFARMFASDPALNASFVTCNPANRPFAVPSEDVLYVMAMHSMQARRLVAKTGTSFIY